MNPLDWLSGSKTYVTAVGSIALGVYQCTQGHFDTGIPAIMAGLGLVFARRASDRPGQ